MKIVYLAAGAAGMYCGSCLHDNTLARALIELGEDVLLVPTYTPLRTDEADVSQRRVFFGGVNVYLQQKLALFRHTPWLLDRLLDQPGLIQLATRLGPGVDPAQLGDLTVSMLSGEHGRQRKELRKLLRWMEDYARPDVLHLSNIMLLGMASELRRALGVPILCTLSGEDIFLEKLVEPHYSQARELIRGQAQHIDAFVALNHYFADFMANYLSVARDRIYVIPHGLDLTGHSMRGAGDAASVITIGYLARICADKGLHNLVSAFELLSADPDLPPLRLKAGGYLGTADRPYLAAFQERVKSWSDPSRFEYVGELNRQQKIALLHSFDIMSVPTVYRESKGISILEALANGVPVVLPAHGAFPELLESTGGGLLCEPQSPGSLAAALKRLILDEPLRRELGQRGYEAVHRQYQARQMAEKTGRLYADLIAGKAARASD